MSKWLYLGPQRDNVSINNVMISRRCGYLEYWTQNWTNTLFVLWIDFINQFRVFRKRLGSSDKVGIPSPYYVQKHDFTKLLSRTIAWNEFLSYLPLFFLGLFFSAWMQQSRTLLHLLFLCKNLGIYSFFVELMLNVLLSNIPTLIIVLKRRLFRINFLEKVNQHLSKFPP